MQLPNQALPEGIPLGQADGCQLGTLNMANIDFSLNNFFFSMNLFRFVYIENYHLPAEVRSARRQGAAA
jgi:hypothetical protein